MVIRLSNALAKAMADAADDYVNAGAASTLVIYSGTPPTEPDASLSGNTALVTFTLGDPAFGTATDANPGGRITANAVADAVAAATGTASFFRLFRDTLATIQGTVTVTGGGGDATISDTAIVSGKSVSLLSMVFTMPES
jgi:hypothetical protein